MDKIATPGRTLEILKDYGLRPSKKMGQNFLIDPNIINIIVAAAGVKEDDTIIEIGPGIGSLTQLILESLGDKGKLFAIEKDDRLAEALNKILGSYRDKLKIINQDALEIKWSEFLKKEGITSHEVKVVANLPYYITTPIIFSLLEADFQFSRLVLMVQKEVAERMVASPGGKDYGALSIAVQYYSKVEIIHQVPPTVFIPRPRVASAVIRLMPYPEPPFYTLNEDFFFKIVQAIFQQRRKNIKNSLLNSRDLSLEKEVILDGLAEAEIEPRIRGEKLPIDKIVTLSNLLWKKFHKSDGDENDVH